jgi:glycolate oxidase FAD binding subunit
LGTLGVATEVTFKVLPAPETVATLAVRGLDDEAASRIMAMAMGSREEVASSAHLPPSVAWRFLDGQLGSEAATILRIEGFAPSVRHRSAQLRALLGSVGVIDLLDETQSRQLWREVRDVLPFVKKGDQRAVWRVSMAPMQGWKMVDELSTPCWCRCLL